MSDQGSESIADQSPSAKLVYTVLSHRGAQTQKQLIEESMLSPRTVRYALSDLSDAGIIAERVYLPDARQRLYELATDATRQRPSRDARHAGSASTAPTDD